MTSIEQLFQQAHHHHHEGKFSEAEQLYHQVLEQDPEHADAMHLLGILAAQFENHLKAIEWITKALAIRPDSALYHNNLANAYKNHGDIEQALLHYQQALNLEVDYVEAHNNLGNLLVQQNKLDEALRHYAKAVQLKPDYIAAHHNLGLLFIKKKNFDAALKQFLNVIQLSPESLSAHYHLGDIYLQRDVLTEAEKYYKIVLQLDPHHIPTLNNLGALYIKQKNDQVAIEYFLKILSLDANNKNALDNIANLYLYHRRYLQAIAYLQTLLEIDPHSIETNYNIAVAYMAQGKLSEAIKYYEYVLQQDPKHFSSLSNLGSIYLGMNRRQEAENYFRSALIINPTDESTQHMLNALTGNQLSVAAPTDYIKNLFDNYATHYERQLIETLHYRIPVLLKDFFKEHFREELLEKNILDLGCGTGLSGEHWNYAAKKLVGIDLSREMLKEAEKKHIYDKLIEEDIHTALKKMNEHFDIIIAADVFIYIGNLEKIISLCKKILTDKGLLLFSVEKTTDNNFKLLPSGRYAHSIDYIKQLAEINELTVAAYKEVVGRRQDGKDVAEYIMIFKM